MWRHRCWERGSHHPPPTHPAPPSSHPPRYGFRLPFMSGGKPLKCNPQTIRIPDANKHGLFQTGTSRQRTSQLDSKIFMLSGRPQIEHVAHRGKSVWRWAKWVPAVWVLFLAHNSPHHPFIMEINEDYSKTNAGWTSTIYFNIILRPRVWLKTDHALSYWFHICWNPNLSFEGLC